MQLKERPPLSPPRLSRDFSKSTRGMTLAEVLIASAILVILTLGLSSTFVHNIRDAKLMTSRTQAVSTAMGVLERIRAIGYVDLATLHDSATSASPKTARVYVLDPSYTSPDPAIPVGHRPVDLYLNVKDGAEIYKNWTPTEMVTNPDNDSRIPIELWFSLTKDESLDTAPRREVMEAILVYRWKIPGVFNQWRYGDVRLAIPKATAIPRKPPASA